MLTLSSSSEGVFDELVAEKSRKDGKLQKYATDLASLETRLENLKEAFTENQNRIQNQERDIKAAREELQQVSQYI